MELHKPIDINKIHEKARFKIPEGSTDVECLELPFFHEYYDMMGFLDAVVIINNKIIIGDFKNKQVPNKNDWKNLVKATFPLDKDVAQLSAYRYVTKDLGYFNADYIGIWYYNICMAGDLDAEWEFYFDIPEEITKHMLDSWKEECIMYKSKQQDGCHYKFCKEHGSERLILKDFLVRI